MIEIKNNFMDSRGKRIDKISERVNGHKLWICTVCKGEADGDSMFMCKKCNGAHSESLARKWKAKVLREME